MLARDQFDWWLDNLATPAGPLHWFRKIQPSAGPARWAMAVAKYVVLAIWASAFIWVWFAIFVVLFLYEGLGLAPWARATAQKPAPPPEPHH